MQRLSPPRLVAAGAVELLADAANAVGALLVQVSTDFVFDGNGRRPYEVDDATAAKIRKAFVLGSQRTAEQDVEFGIVEISDIAIKALSPGINDPTTALHCIDRLSEILLELGTRAPPNPWRTEEGRVHYLARNPTFERAVGLAFDQLRHFGASNPGIARRLLEALARLALLVPSARRPVLLAQARAVLDDAGARIEAPADRAALLEAARRLPGLTGG